MSNLSKKKRAEMLEYLSELKKIHSDDESVRALNAIETALTEKKYGLVWEEHSEKVDEMLVDHIPVFTEVEDRKITADKEDDYNFLLEGDNLHSLKLLEKTHKGKIDVIYIDPPYNTGAKNWKYNNDFVDANDTFRHSKWISFMSSRLKIARVLLKENGILILTIDDYEIQNILMILNEIFGEDNRLGTVVIKNNPSGRSTTSGFSIAHEYALFYGKTCGAQIGRLERTDEQIARYKERDSQGRFEWVNFRARYTTDAPSMQYPIYIMKDGSDFRIPAMIWNPENKSYVVLENPTNDELISYPIDDSGRMRSWKWSIDTVKKYKNTELAIRRNRSREPAVYMKARMKTSKMLPLTWWGKSEYSATSQGTNLLKKILNADSKFDYPKSLYAVIDCIKVGSENKSAIILDFFAGSGTTGHAVAQLNKEDGGNRKYILCTNNENNICEEVTYQRLKNIQGDLPHNLKYFKTDFIKKFSEEEDIVSDRLLDHIKEMVELENMCEIDGENHILILSDDELEALEQSDIKAKARVYVPSYVLLSRELENEFERKDVQVIAVPDYYFLGELREVGEL